MPPAVFKENAKVISLSVEKRYTASRCNSLMELAL